VELGLDDNQSALIAAKELLALLSFRKKATRRVQADADSLIAGFGDAAFNVARERAQRSAMIDGDRPRGHWTRVKIEIAKRQGIKIARSKADKQFDRKTIRGRRNLLLLFVAIVLSAGALAYGVNWWLLLEANLKEASRINYPGPNSRVSDPTEIVKADNGPAKQQTETASSADIPAQEAAILSKTPEPSPVPRDNGTNQPLALTPAEERTLAIVAPIESQTPIESDRAVMPPASAQVPMPAEPLSTAALGTVKTDPFRPDDTLSPNGAPPQANIKRAPLPPQSPAAAKAPTAKTAGRVVRPLKPAAARHPGSHGQPRQIANKVNAMSMYRFIPNPTVGHCRACRSWVIGIRTSSLRLLHPLIRLLWPTIKKPKLMNS
jgi:hypothetical protein